MLLTSSNHLIFSFVSSKSGCCSWILCASTQIRSEQHLVSLFMLGSGTYSSKQILSFKEVLGFALPSHVKSLHVHQSHVCSMLPLNFHIILYKNTVPSNSLIVDQLVSANGSLKDCQYKNCLTDIRILFLKLDGSLGCTITVFS